jgi:hypothetical protein
MPDRRPVSVTANQPRFLGHDTPPDLDLDLRGLNICLAPHRSASRSHGAGAGAGAVGGPFVERRVVELPATCWECCFRAGSRARTRTCWCVCVCDPERVRAGNHDSACCRRRVQRGDGAGRT